MMTLRRSRVICAGYSVGQTGIKMDTVMRNSYSLKALRSTNAQLIWLTEHQKSFKKLKLELATSPSLNHINSKCETRFETDTATKKIFERAVIQKHDCDRKTVAADSRYLKDVDTRYAMFELKA